MSPAMNWCRSALLAASCVLPSVRLLGQPSPAATLLGCWTFELAGDSTAGRSTTLTPPLAELTEVVPRLGSGSVVRRLDARGRWLDSSARMVLPTWEVLPDGDSIRVTFSLGFANSVYVLGWQRKSASGRVDTLEGRATEWFDYGPQLVPRGAARAIRRMCPNPP